VVLGLTGYRLSACWGTSLQISTSTLLIVEHVDTWLSTSHCWYVRQVEQVEQVRIGLPSKPYLDIFLVCSACLEEIDGANADGVTQKMEAMGSQVLNTVSVVDHGLERVLLMLAYYYGRKRGGSYHSVCPVGQILVDEGLG
jgi:hypothetical protein